MLVNIMMSNNKKVFFIASCYALLIGAFFIGGDSLTRRIITPNQRFLGAQAITTKNIALTFDDGPYGTSTEKILDILKQENVHATFFVIGKNVEKFPAIAQRIVAEGNLIENHSYDHSEKLTEMSTTTFEENIQKAESSTFSHTGLKPRFFRPPYSKITAQMFGRLNQDGYTTVLWNDSAEDWDYKKVPTELIEKTIIRDAKPNGIIVLHDGRDTEINYPRDNTINALPHIIKQLKKEGYNFVTVDKIVDIKPYFE
jgi:peptidoglycan-N-acetylglucosamine deacetylase